MSDSEVLKNIEEIYKNGTNNHNEAIEKLVWVKYYIAENGTNTEVIGYANMVYQIDKDNIKHLRNIVAKFSNIIDSKPNKSEDDKSQEETNSSTEIIVTPQSEDNKSQEEKNNSTEIIVTPESAEKQQDNNKKKSTAEKLVEIEEYEKNLESKYKAIFEIKYYKE